MDTNLNSTSAHNPEQPVKTSLVNVGATERILSVGGGLILAALGLRDNRPSNIAMAFAGGVLLFRGLTGYCPANAALGRNTADTKTSSLEVFTTVTVNKTREEVYAYWRRLQNLPSFMKHIKNVHQYNDVRSYWEADLAGIGEVSWEADIMLEERGYRLAWESIEGSRIDTAGEVRFTDAGPEKTELQVSIKYRVPVGAAGDAVAKLFNRSVENTIREDINRFKKVIENKTTEEVII